MRDHLQTRQPRYGDSLGCVQYLLSRPDIVPDPKDEYGGTPLSDEGCSEAIMIAIIRDGRADLNAGGPFGYRFVQRVVDSCAARGD